MKQIRRNAKKTGKRAPCISCTAWEKKCDDMRPCLRCVSLSIKCLNRSNGDLVEITVRDASLAHIERPLNYIGSVLKFDKESSLHLIAHQIGWAHAHLLRSLSFGYRIDHIAKILNSLSQRTKDDVANVFANIQARVQRIKCLQGPIPDNPLIRNDPGDLVGSFAMLRLHDKEELWDGESMIGFHATTWSSTSQQRLDARVNSRMAGLFQMHWYCPQPPSPASSLVLPAPDPLRNQRWEEYLAPPCTLREPTSCEGSI